MKNVNKIAAQDALTYARAQVMTGKGAGNARKLANMNASYKMERISGYQEAFDKALANIDIAKLAAREQRIIRINGTSTAILAGAGITIFVLNKLDLTEPIVEWTQERVNRGFDRLRSLTKKKEHKK